MTKTKKIVIISVSCVLAAILVTLAIGLPFLFRSGAVPETLQKPILTADGDTVSWGAVEGAGSYTVTVNDTVVKQGSAETSYTIPADIAEVDNDGETVSLSVTAVTGVADKENSVSDTLVLKRLVLDTFADSVDGKDYYCWYDLYGAGGYEVTVGGQKTEAYTFDEAQKLYMLPLLDGSGDTVTIKAVSNTPYILSSQFTESLSRAPLSAPENLNVTGALVTWDKVLDAAGNDVRRYDVFVDGQFQKAVAQPFYTHTEKTDGTDVTVKAAGLFASNLSAESAPVEVSFDEFSLFAAAVQKAKTSYKAIELQNQAETRMMLGLLTVRGNIIVNFGRDIYSMSLAQGTAIATRALESYYAEGGKRFVRETPHVSENLAADFSGARPWSMTSEEFNTNFGGRGAYDFIYYDVSADGVRAVTQELAYDAATDNFTFSVSLNVPAGTEKNRFDVIEVGGLEGCAYVSCDLTFTINSQMNFVSYRSHDVYEANKVGINARTDTRSHYTFLYYNEYRDIDALKNVAWATE
jgi:hypothetical protein